MSQTTDAAIDRLDAAEKVKWPSECHDPDSCARHRRCMYINCRHKGAAIDRLDVKAEAKSAEAMAVQDTWFTDSKLPVVAMSGDIESDHVLKLHFRRPVTDQDRIDLTDAMNMKILSEAKSQEPEAGQLSVREFREDAFRSMEVQICGDTRTVQFGVEDHGGDHPTMPCCAISWTDAADLASWVQSCIAPAVSVDAIKAALRPFIGHDTLGVKVQDAARVVAALIAGGRCGK